MDLLTRVDRRAGALSEMGETFDNIASFIGGI